MKSGITGCSLSGGKRVRESRGGCVFPGESECNAHSRINSWTGSCAVAEECSSYSRG